MRLRCVLSISTLIALCLIACVLALAPQPARAQIGPCTNNANCSLQNLIVNGNLLLNGVTSGTGTNCLSVSALDLVEAISLPCGTVLGPSTTVSGDAALWNNTVGTLLSDGGGPPLLARVLTPGDTNYTIPEPNVTVETTALTTTRQWTLPAAASSPAGTIVNVVDKAGVITSTIGVEVLPAGSDTINGGASFTLQTEYATAGFMSDGTSKWTLVYDLVIQPFTPLANSFLTGLGANGVFTASQPTVGNLQPVAQGVLGNALATSASPALVPLGAGLLFSSGQLQAQWQVTGPITSLGANCTIVSNVFNCAGGSAAVTEVTSATPNVVVTPTTGIVTVGTQNAVNAQSVSSYTVQTTDSQQTVEMISTSATAVSLPDPSTSGFGSTFSTEICTETAASLITPAGPGTINGGTSIGISPWQCAQISSDGTNYEAQVFLTQSVVANASSTGTANNKLASITGGTALIVSAGATSGSYGVVVGGGATTGNAQIATTGVVPLAMDGTSTAGDIVQISASAAGEGHDSGSSSCPGAGQIIGRVVVGGSGAGTYLVALGASGCSISGQAYAISWINGQNPNNALLLSDLQVPIVITAIVGRVEVANGASSSVSVYAAPSGTACGSGVDLTNTTSFNANGTAATNQTLAGTTSTVPAGYSLCLQTSGTWTSTTAASGITVYANATP